MVKDAVIGFGYLGPNMVRNFNAQSDGEIHYVVDLRKERLEAVNMLYPSVKTTTSSDEAIPDPNIDAAVIGFSVLPSMSSQKKKHYVQETLLK